MGWNDPPGVRLQRPGAVCLSSCRRRAAEKFGRSGAQRADLEGERPETRRPDLLPNRPQRDFPCGDCRRWRGVHSCAGHRQDGASGFPGKRLVASEGQGSPEGAVTHPPKRLSAATGDYSMVWNATDDTRRQYQRPRVNRLVTVRSPSLARTRYTPDERLRPCSVLPFHDNSDRPAAATPSSSVRTTWPRRS